MQMLLSTGGLTLRPRSSTSVRRERPKRSWMRSTTGIPSSCKLKQTQESRPRSSSPGTFCFQKQSAFGKETCAAGELEGARPASNPIDSRRAAATRSPKVRPGFLDKQSSPELVSGDFFVSNRADWVNNHARKG